MQMTSGAVTTCRFENVCIPEQPLKLCPTESVVRISSEDTVNVMTMPCAVVPFHWPTLSDERDGDVGSLPHAEASSPASVPTRKSAFVREAIVTPPALSCIRFTRAACCVSSSVWQRPAAHTRRPHMSVQLARSLAAADGCGRWLASYSRIPLVSD